MRELQEKHSMHSRNEIIEVLDEVNTQYGSNFKLKTRNIITTPNLGGLPDEDMAKLIKLDACPVYFNYVFDVEDIMPILKKRVEYDDKYTVINKKEPRGQSVAENGIPCTTKYCVTELNRLSQDNEKLEARLKLLSDFTEDFTQQINRSIMAENHILIEKLHATDKLLTDLYEEINGNYIETLGRDDELAIDCAEAQLQLIKEIIDKVEKI